ncbi:uncharacterized protein PAC_09842 [Phialocephala subalpina]|uniref:Ubiquitin-like domain-containing protein n=1 Tax=Phialocephala subalpina TaxID=576137 RepID=A0A1L7X4M4_9HELO|nr:uncharacterized protein PAC_09842 [Phialocephala subalpina]
MSFGFSVGDFLAAGKLINDIVSSLRHSSASSYRELVLELHGLKRALDEIEHLQCPPGQEPALNSVKVAALMCQYPLDEFASKLKKYERLDIQHGDNLSKSDKLKGWGRKFQWGVGMEEDVVMLRAYIATHVGSLNMRLITVGLATTFSSMEQSRAETSILQSKLEVVRSEVIESRREQSLHGSMITKTSSLLEHLSDLVSIGIGIRLETLIELAQNIWKSNLQIIAVVTQLQSQPPRPNASRTWFQDPVRFEDALGRVLPIPSEYGWSKVHAIIADQFSAGPGSNKVKAGEYLLFNSLDSSKILLQPHTESLIPGMSITMALIIGRYGSITLDGCPRIGCVSRNIEASEAGGKFCTLCRCWFNSTNKRIALPLRPERTPLKTYTTEYIPRGRLRRKRHAITIFDSNNPSNFNDRRGEGGAFKNLLIHFIDLPATPPIVSFRERKKPTSHTKQNPIKFDGFIPKNDKVGVTNDKDGPYPVQQNIEAGESYNDVRSECGWAIAPSIISESRTIQTTSAILFHVIPDSQGTESSNRLARWLLSIGDGIGDGIGATFACHFHKKDPYRYNGQNRLKYRNCAHPTILQNDLRRHLKDHLNHSHRLAQCDRCYSDFGSSIALVEHRQLPNECEKRPALFKEGMDDRQWDRICYIMYTKGRSDFDKWFDIWKILFPDTPPPQTPWNKSETLSMDPPLDNERIRRAFELGMATGINQGFLPRDDQLYQYLFSILRGVDTQSSNATGIDTEPRHASDVDSRTAANNESLATGWQTGAANEINETNRTPNPDDTLAKLEKDISELRIDGILRSRLISIIRSRL